MLGTATPEHAVPIAIPSFSARRKPADDQEIDLVAVTVTKRPAPVTRRPSKPTDLSHAGLASDGPKADSVRSTQHNDFVKDAECHDEVDILDGIDVNFPSDEDDEGAAFSDGALPDDLHPGPSPIPHLLVPSMSRRGSTASSVGSLPSFVPQTPCNTPNQSYPFLSSSHLRSQLQAVASLTEGRNSSLGSSPVPSMSRRPSVASSIASSFVPGTPSNTPTATSTMLLSSPTTLRSGLQSLHASLADHLAAAGAVPSEQVSTSSSAPTSPTQSPCNSMTSSPPSSTLTTFSTSSPALSLVEGVATAAPLARSVTFAPAVEVNTHREWKKQLNGYRKARKAGKDGGGGGGAKWRITSLFGSSL
ncbi:hypothetical protein HKX48_008563 [Thoreauomyces humboldtii]|nr:hypothetical protein HKX48_008563 [Thoreauomyces humboldtii]